MTRVPAVAAILVALATCGCRRQQAEEQQQPAAQMADTAHMMPGDSAMMRDTSQMMGDTAMARDTAKRM